MLYVRHLCLCSESAPPHIARYGPECTCVGLAIVQLWHRCLFSVQPFLLPLAMHVYTQVKKCVCMHGESWLYTIKDPTVPVLKAGPGTSYLYGYNLLCLSFLPFSLPLQLLWLSHTYSQEPGCMSTAMLTCLWGLVNMAVQQSCQWHGVHMGSTFYRLRAAKQI